jgi:hypothetical protein
MVASEARLVVNDTVCCQLLHQIQSYRTPYTSVVCRQLTPSLHTPFFAQKTSAKRKKESKEHRSKPSFSFALAFPSQPQQQQQYRSDATLIR